jgi:hypothetical protein
LTHLPNKSWASIQHDHSWQRTYTSALLAQLHHQILKCTLPSMHPFSEMCKFESSGSNTRELRCQKLAIIGVGATVDEVGLKEPHPRKEGTDRVPLHGDHAQMGRKNEQQAGSNSTHPWTSVTATTLISFHGSASRCEPGTAFDSAVCAQPTVSTTHDRTAAGHLLLHPITRQGMVL